MIHDWILVIVAGVLPHPILSFSLTLFLISLQFYAN